MAPLTSRRDRGERKVPPVRSSATGERTRNGRKRSETKKSGRRLYQKRETPGGEVVDQTGLVGGWGNA